MREEALRNLKNFPPMIGTVDSHLILNLSTFPINDAVSALLPCATS